MTGECGCVVVGRRVGLSALSVSVSRAKVMPASPVTGVASVRSAAVSRCGWVRGSAGRAVAAVRVYVSLGSLPLVSWVVLGGHEPGELSIMSNYTESGSCTGVGEPHASADGGAHEHVFGGRLNYVNVAR